jgi:5-methylcytosine-specific restriction endonuclease McrA
MRAHQGVCHVCKQAGADEIDHIIPLAQGGLHVPANWAPIHGDPCHKAKTARESGAARRKGDSGAWTPASAEQAPDERPDVRDHDAARGR